LISKLTDLFGQQCVVVAIDAKRNYSKQNGKTFVDTTKGSCWFEVYTYGGRKPTGIDAIQWALKAAELGAGEFLLTSMDCDGTKDGYDLDLTRAISERVNVPIIASGGAGKPEHFLEAFTKGKADAALAASVFHYDQYPVRVVKEYLRNMGVTVRP
jgi:imidazole glycerol-phosphate synthase subunit HisF